jgi:hypothetical protein
LDLSWQAFRKIICVFRYDYRALAPMTSIARIFPLFARTELG